MVKTAQKKYLANEVYYEILAYYLCGITLLLILINLIGKPTPKKVLAEETEANTTKVSLLKEKTFLQDFLKTHHDYLPGWLELAKVNLSLNDNAGFKKALQEGKRIDPNSYEVEKLEKVVGTIRSNQ